MTVEMRLMISGWLLLFLVYSSNSLSQNLSNSEWTRIKSERKDGSRIIASSRSEVSNKVTIKRQGSSDIGYLTYHFKESDLITWQYSPLKENYNIKDEVLSIGYFYQNRFNTVEQFHIDSLRDKLLILTELPKEKLADDKINRYYYVKSENYFDYLLKNKKIIFNTDSVIESSKMFAPSCDENLDFFLVGYLSPMPGNAIAKGHLIFDSKGAIQKLSIDEVQGLKEKDVENLQEALLSTKGLWRFPKINDKYKLKLNFTCQYYYGSGPMMENYIKFFYNLNDTTKRTQLKLSANEIQSATKYFNKGIRLLSQNKYENAIAEFSKCIELDPLDLDSYYNIAHSFYKLGQTQRACDSWKILKELGQKQGEQIFNENCK